MNFCIIEMQRKSGGAVFKVSLGTFVSLKCREKVVVLFLKLNMSKSNFVRVEREGEPEFVERSFELLGLKGEVNVSGTHFTL